MKLREANIQTLIKLGVGVIGVIFSIIVITSAWFQIEAGFTYVYQNTLIVKNSRNVTVITATQYTGEEFFQGGLNQFKAKLEDQLREGVYETERKQVEVEQTDLAPVGLEQEDSNKLQRAKQLVWKTAPILDTSGQIRRARGLQGLLSGGSAARHRHRAVHQPSQFHGGHARQLRADWR